MENAITYQVYGRYALFTDPITRIGGEKTSLFVPTYQALVGVTESIYWKPSIKWRIEKIRILNPIRTESKGIRPIKYGGGNDLSYATYLSDVSYIVKAHFEWNENRKDLAQDFIEHKHFFIAKRCIEKGGRRDIWLGTRECAAYVVPCDFDQEQGYYDNYGEMDFGMQFHSFSYPDENGEGILYARFWKPKMVNGVIEFCKPEECSITKKIHKMNKKTFTEGINFSGLKEPGLLHGDQGGNL
ncbi:type I-C CRISPR-associated protein Cas5 [Anaerocolumna cellulosilytica]|uniref:pre-crRNA processing endonuclease n=1 Tax=Anaerocolumna cellulosilytica TaxID=433286 RepID=A0A6S6QX92_9FIRM|nr:type I-C CRISPR-associated protein Cas5c [Anaerocolumna cellulosilytica]MBB5194692.1 CRISPR-associated protein Cas5d [Anaerocolumna cellulosilytica]BCJ94346.1 type I-C CRISPR-associated protein Cas5 [Anaerocolumna cellulosilytica]